MPKKKEKNNEEKIKVKGLFDHLNAILKTQDPNYFSKLSDADKKTWSNYMINRFLSMNEDWVEIISELDKYTTAQQLNPKLAYKLYIDIFPKSNIFLKYIKNEKDKSYKNEVIELISKYFQISKKEAIEYLNIFYSSSSNLEELKDIIKKYGFTDKEINKMISL